MLLNFLILSAFIDYPFDHNIKKLKKNDLINSFQISLASQNVDVDKIAIVDFRSILKKSKAMKTLGKEFILLENKLNKEMQEKQKYLKNKELIIMNAKSKLSNSKYKERLDSFKNEVFIIQKKIKEDRAILNNSFQKIQNDLKDLLAKVIKNLSIKRNISLVILKENIFLFNKKSLDISDEVLQIFNDKTKSLKIIISSSG